MAQTDHKLFEFHHNLKLNTIHFSFLLKHEVKKKIVHSQLEWGRERMKMVLILVITSRKHFQVNLPLRMVVAFQLPKPMKIISVFRRVWNVHSIAVVCLLFLCPCVVFFFLPLYFNESHFMAHSTEIWRWWWIKHTQKKEKNTGEEERLERNTAQTQIYLNIKFAIKPNEAIKKIS